MRITNRAGRWYSAEVVSKKRTGYGTYRLRVQTPPDFDKNVTFGAFSWGDAESNSREIDFIELGDFGRSNDPTNAQFVVQPWQTTGNLDRFTVSGSPIDFSATWNVDSIRFEAANSMGLRLREWRFTGSVPKADSDALRFRLNLWLFGGLPPSDGQEAEVIISDVTFPAALPQRLASLTPVTGAGANQTFKAVFRHLDGSRGHYLGYLLLLPTPNIVWFTARGSCLVEYNRISALRRNLTDRLFDRHFKEERFPVDCGV